MKKILKRISVVFIVLFIGIIGLALIDGSNDESTLEPTAIIEETKTEVVEEKIEENAASLGEINCLAKAESYLDLMGFSEKGLRHQLEFEGFESEEIDYAIANIEVDWNEECAEKAESYLDTMSFSKDGLRGQLEFEDFTSEQIEYGLKAVGY